MIINAVVALGLAPLIGFSAAALGTTVAGWTMLAQLWLGTRRLEGATAIDTRLARAMPRLLVSCLVMTGVLVGAEWLLADWLTTATLRYPALLLLVLAGMASYGLAVLATGALSLADARAAMRRGG